MNTRQHRLLKQSIKILVLLAIWSSNVHARVGCIDNSFHLKQSPDYKQYHYVQCSCPCKEFAHVQGRDKCLKCGHYHAPLPKIFITKGGIIHE